MPYVNIVNHVSPGNGTEMMLSLIDLSGSMISHDWPPSRVDGAITANKELIRAKSEQTPRDIMGIIGFGTNAVVLHKPVSLDVGAYSLIRALDGIDEMMGGTNITDAINLAESEFTGKSSGRQFTHAKASLSWSLTDILFGISRKAEVHLAERTHLTCDSSVTMRAILLSDGGHNAAGRSPVKAANRLKEAGIIIDCIGIGGTPDKVDEDTLRKIASSNSDGTVRYSFIGDKHRLIQKYRSLANHIRPV